jgi:hypothetical protein
MGIVLAFVLPVLAAGSVSGLSAGRAAAAGMAPQGTYNAVPHVPKVKKVRDLRMSAHGKHLLHTFSRAGGGSGSSFTSTNWDGYFASEAGSPSNQTTFNEVQAQWKVQPVTCDPNGGTQWLGDWVGLDGWYNGSVEQGGTEAICSGSTPSYAVWWEMFPFNLIQSGFSVSPGDSIQASVTFNAPASEFDIVVRDVTSGQTLTEDTPCQPGQNGCARSTAEVISEDIGGGTDTDGLFALPNYGTSTFSGISLTDVGNHTGTLTNSAWTANEVTEVSSQGVTKQTTSGLSTDGSSFSTTWKAEFGGSASVTLDYQTPNTSVTTNQPQPQFELVNSGTVAIPLSAITIRYWFTEDGTQPLQFFCDFTPAGCSNVSGTFAGTTLGGQDHYLQLSFSPGAGTLGPGSNTGLIQTRFSETNWANMTQSNDYSWNNADTTLRANPQITVYDNGTLIYGIEP